MGIIFNEIVFNKRVFRMVLLLVIDVKYFNVKKCHYFCPSGFSKARANLGMAKRNLPSYFV